MAPKTKGDKENNQHIQVAVRCRPLNSQEKKSGSYSVVDLNTDRKEVNIKERLIPTAGVKTFTFDRVFGANSKQIEVYRTMVVPTIEEVLQGYNCTIFAYGQTGTGKTFTMEGEKSDDPALTWETDPLTGIIPRAMNHLFHRLKAMDLEYSVRISFLEIYNEELIDLLGADTVDNPRLKIYEDNKSKGSCVIHGLEEAVVNDSMDVYQILQQGANKRQTAATLMNAHSSRSHSLFMVTVHMKENSVEGEEMLKIGKINLVDLAGSECIGRSGAVDKRAREAGNINQSLLTLGRVITALVEHAPHVPYRESKLTRLLQDSLGGKTKTSIIATISPASCNIDETLSTLDYAFRAKNITNRPEINQRLTKKTLIKEYGEEIERLRKDLQAARDKNGVYLAQENYDAMTIRLAQQSDSIKELEEKISIVQSEFAKMTELFTETKEELEETTNKLVATEETLHQTQSKLRKTRKDRDEQKHLVGKHVEAEGQLFGQANQLLRVADVTTSDVAGLHAKLDRKRHVEADNEMTQEEFRKRFCQHVATIKAQMTEANDEHVAAVDTMRNKMTAMLSRRSEEVLCLGNQLSSVTETLTQGLADINGRFTANVTEGQTWTDDLKDYCSQSKESEVCRQFSFFEETFKTQMESLQSMLCTVKSDLSQMSQTLNTQVESLTEQIRLSTDRHLSALQSQEDLVVSFTTNIAQALEKYTQDTAAEMKSQAEKEAGMAEQVIALMRQMIETQQEHKQQTTEKAKLVNCKDRCQTFNQNALSQISSTRSQVKEDHKALETQCQSDNTAAQRHLTKVGEDLDALLRKEAEIQRQTAEFSQESLQSLEIHTEQVQKRAGEHREKLQEMAEATTQALQAQCSECRTSVQSISETQNTQHSQLQSDVEQNSVDSQQHREDLCAFTHACIQELEASDAMVERFLSEELKKDTPTGTTPQRKEYRYPLKLTKTDRHSLLLTEFREQYILEEAMNTPIPDDSIVEDQPSLKDDAEKTKHSENGDEEIQNISSDSALSSVSGVSSSYEVVGQDAENKENSRTMRPPTKAPVKAKVAARSHSNPRQPLRSRSPTPQKQRIGSSKNNTPSNSKSNTPSGVKTKGTGLPVKINNS